MDSSNNKICRMCAKSFQKNLPSLLEENDIFFIHFIHNEEYIIKIVKNDGKPQNVCLNCKKLLLKVTSFLTKCHESEKILSNSQHEANKEIKIEIKVEEISVEDKNEFVESNSDKQNDIDNDEDEFQNIIEEVFEDHTADEHVKIETKNDDVKKNHIQVEINGKENLSVNLKENSDENYLDKKKFQSRNCQKKNFLCHLCGEKFNKQDSLDNHANKHLGIKPFECEICKKAFSNRNSYRYHVNKHTKTEIYSCQTCGKKFTTKSFYRTHLLRHEKGDLNEKNERPYKCPYCPNSFKFLSTLTAHCKIHNKKSDQKYKCSDCHATFHRSDRLREHINGVHLKIFPFKCDKCDKAFVTGAMRNKHVKEYHSGVRFKCDICNKDFSLAATLSKHRRIHNNDKRFVCEICNMSFIAVYEIDKHMKTHEGKIDDKLKEDLIVQTYKELTKVEDSCNE